MTEEVFKCLDGSGAFPVEFLCDEFVDCEDGSMSPKNCAPWVGGRAGSRRAKHLKKPSEVVPRRMKAGQPRKVASPPKKAEQPRKVASPPKGEEAARVASPLQRRGSRFGRRSSGRGRGSEVPACWSKSPKNQRAAVPPPASGAFFLALMAILLASGMRRSRN